MNTFIWTLTEALMGTGSVVATLLVGVLATVALPGLAGATERVEYDATSGNYIVEYVDPDEGQVYMVIEPPNKVIASVRAKVSPMADGRFRYEYLLSVAPTSPQRLHELRFLVPPGVAKSDVSGPEGWHSTFAELRQSVWWADVQYKRHGVAPGASQDGLSVVAPGLPSRIRAVLEGWTGEDKYGGVIAFRGEPTTAVAAAVNAITRDPSKWGKFVDIVGPVAAPKTFDPMKFVDHLLDLKNQSVTLGWMKDDAVGKKLGDTLAHMQTVLQGASGTTIPSDQAAQLLSLGNAFQKDVEAGSCKEFGCADPRPLTSEAYALLFFNMDYFLSQVRLACGIAPPAPPSSPAPKRSPTPAPAPKRK